MIDCPVGVVADECSEDAGAIWKLQGRGPQTLRNLLVPIRRSGDCPEEAPSKVRFVKPSGDALKQIGMIGQYSDPVLEISPRTPVPG